MTWPEIEPRSPGPLANTLATRQVSRFIHNQEDMINCPKLWKSYKTCATEPAVLIAAFKNLHFFLISEKVHRIICIACTPGQKAETKDRGSFRLVLATKSRIRFSKYHMTNGQVIFGSCAHEPLKGRRLCLIPQHEYIPDPFPMSKVINF